MFLVKVRILICRTSVSKRLGSGIGYFSDSFGSGKSPGSGSSQFWSPAEANSVFFLGSGFDEYSDKSKQAKDEAKLTSIRFS